ncbi:helix-turn-helix domain-containing protein [Halomarina litorea]|uniref:helix-turn-helix domain-containing protein n=1 Tax=Halomarina litorea TaxID=2961595 RepID=UPI0020C28423|nr:helix-turn-helix domain-containing protein [Halomarina sp. BCD28]
MPRARLRVDLSPDTWVHAVSTAHPEATLRVLAALSEGRTGVGLLDVLGVTDALLDAMRDQRGVTALDVLARDDERALLRFETSQPLLLQSAHASGVPLELPVTVRDGTATLRVTAPRERLRALRDQFERDGLAPRVEAVSPSTPDGSVLTDRQREILERAVELGYYETPRRVTLSDLAADLGVAKSTLSETLHRAESTLVRRHLDVR